METGERERRGKGKRIFARVHIRDVQLGLALFYRHGKEERERR